MSLVNNVNDEYKVLEWDIQKDRNILCDYSQFLTKDDLKNAHENNRYSYPDHFSERISKTVTNPRFFSDTSPKPVDVKQGIRGDYWLHAIISAAASIPGLIESIAVARKEDSYASNLNSLKDKWVGIVVDDYLFYKTQERTLLFSECKDPRITWVPLLEKAYAKCHNNYENIYGRCMPDALVGFGGKDYKAYKTYVIKHNPAKKDKLWNSFPSDMKKNNSIFVCHGESVGCGLISRHVYSIIRAVNFHNHRLVEVRNPWEHGEWKGSWSNKRYNQEWSPWIIQKDNKHYIEKLNYFLNDHDSFFMECDDLLNQFDIIERCYYTSPATHNGLDLTNKLTSSWWNGEYNIFYATLGQDESDLSILKLKFSTQQLGDSTLSITSHGNNGIAYPKDGIGTYIIDEGKFNLSSKTITFIKRYVNCNGNVVWNYRGQYKHKLFFGTWGTHYQSFGNFIMKRAVKVESLSLTGIWHGCYFYALDNQAIDYYLMNLNFNENVITGPGTDSVGGFKINGEILPNGSVGFIKVYTTHSWNYFGQIFGSENLWKMGYY
ncbi:cysteine proteinase [Gigaspora margarita]|uniref:Cysteine proteinase n=1 Tax=Gigaspora margarita TaxID=4874 RepID=A0A8H3XEV2_GIGMA|nr:cysteine proteinase [Gigaspora margarita]